MSLEEIITRDCFTIFQYPDHQPAGSCLNNPLLIAPDIYQFFLYPKPTFIVKSVADNIRKKKVIGANIGDIDRGNI